MRIPRNLRAAARALMLPAWVLMAAAAITLPAAAAADPQAARFYEDALVRYEKQDYAGAIIQLKNATRIDARLLPVQVLLGKALLANGEVAAAEVALNQALLLGVNRAEVVLPLARALVGQARLVEVVGSDPRLDPAGLPPAVRQELLLVKAAAQADLGAHREALRAIQEARAIDPAAPQSWLAEVPVQIRALHFNDAQAAVRQALQLAPGMAEAHYLQGSIAHAQGRVPQALADYDRALALDARHVEARVSRAGLYMDQGRLDDVLRETTEARRLAPSDPRPKYLAALVAERRGDAKAARAGLIEITGLLDTVPIAFMRFRPQILMLGGLAHFGQGNNEKARPYLEAVQRLQPDGPAAKLLAQIYLADKNADRAIETLEAYIKARPGDGQAVVLLATAQMSRGRPARASLLLQDALKTQDSPRLHTFLGLTLAGGGRLADAQVELEKAYRKDPSQVAAGAGLIELYLRGRQPAKAVEIAESLVRRTPKEAQTHALLAYALAAAGELKRARASYDKALQLDPGFTAVQLGLARLDMRERQYDAAQQRLARILAADEKNVEALMESALLAERRGQTAQAVQQMSKAADHSPTTNTVAGISLLDLHLRGGRIDEARQALQAVQGKAPDSLAVLMAGARLHLAAREVPAARAELLRASRTPEADARTLTQVALLQLQAGDASNALHTVGKAQQADPTLLQAMALEVDVQLRLGDLAQADRAARELARKQPTLALSAALLGDVAAARGQTAAALEAYRRAHALEPGTESLLRIFRLQERQDAAAAAQLATAWLKSHPDDAPVRRVLAANQARQGKLGPARALYEAQVAADPQDAESLNNLANVMLLQKDPKALQVAEQALARQPGAAHIIGTAGWAAFHAGQGDRALQLLRDARLRDPTNADTRYFLGAVLASKGRKTEASDELQAALNAGRGFAHAAQAQTLLESLK